MLEKLDYLKDLAGHPGTSGAKAAGRLGVRENAALQAFRRAVQQELAEGDRDRPEKFTLTRKGQQKLAVLEKERSEASESNPDGNPGQAGLTAPADVPQHLADLEADVRALTRMVNKGSQAEGGAGRGNPGNREDNPGNPEDNPGEPSASVGATQRRLVAELFEARTEKASLGMFDDKGPVNETIERLQAQIPLGLARAVLRLRELETESFRDPEGAEAEAAWLREKLSLPKAGNPDNEEDADGLDPNGEDAEKESESDVWEEFFGS